jgi:hypothetical protein
MLPTDDSTRDLLPPIAAAADDILGVEMPFVGSVAFTSDAPPPDGQPALHADDGPPQAAQEHWTHEDDSGGAFMKVPPSDTATSSANSIYSATLVLDPEGNQFVPVSIHQASLPKASAISDGVGASGSHNIEDGRGLHEVRGDDAGGVQNPGDSADGLTENDNAFSINVSQVAIVDQEASIIVRGYVGDVVAHLHIDQDLLMDQDVGIDFAIDGDGHFNITLDQDVRIDQDVEIDIDIFDVNDVLYIDIFLHDSIEVEQETTISIEVGDGPLGGTVEVNQDIEMEQDVDIDIDIEAELEERYIINVQIETLQQANVDQDAVIDVEQWNGATDIDVDATQIAIIDQQTIIDADFALV